MADVFSLVATLGLDSSGFLTGLATAGGVFSNFASMVTGFVSDVMSTGMGFDSAMSSVEAVLGRAEGTEENMTRLRAFALDQARDSVYTAEQTAQAYYYMGMAGWKTEQMLTGLPAVMDLAAASGEDLGRVSDILTDSLTAFHLTADDAAWYADLLAQTATNANTNVGLMGETFKYLAPTAGALGMDVKDVAWTIGLVANAGIKGSQAGTSLAQVLTRISTNAGASQNKLGALDIITEKLGVNVRDSEGHMRDWSDIIGETRDAWQNLTEAEQMEYAKQIASQRGMPAWLALMGMRREEIEKLGIALDDVNDAAEGMAETRLDNLAGDVTKFNSALDILKIAIYDDVKGPMREITQWGTDAINAITDAINERGLAGGIEVLGQKIEEAGDTFGPMLESIGRAAAPMIDTLITEILPRVVEVGASLGKGLLEGMSEYFQDKGGLSGLLGTGINLLSGGLDAVGTGAKLIRELGGIFVNPLKNELGIDLNDLVENDQIDVEIVPTLKSSSIQDAIDEAKANGETTVTIDGIEFDIDEPAEEIAKALGYVGLDAGKVMADNISSELTQAAPGMGDTISEEIGNAGTPAASSFFSLFSGSVEDDAPSLRDSLSTTLGNAGSGAGSSIASGIQGALNLARFTVSVSGILSNVVNRFRKNASAMSAGRIFSSPTVFGYAEGAFQVAGDAGPEAVVGVNSLSQMIQSAVKSAVGGAVEVPRAGTTARNITVIMNMDGREFARTTLPYLDAEEQRVGVRLSRGG